MVCRRSKEEKGNKDKAETLGYRVMDPVSA